VKDNDCCETPAQKGITDSLRETKTLRSNDIMLTTFESGANPIWKGGFFEAPATLSSKSIFVSVGNILKSVGGNCRFGNLKIKLSAVNENRQ